MNHYYYKQPTIKHLFSFFHKLDFHLSYLFPRNILLDTSKYLFIHNHIHILKLFAFNSYYLNSLYKTSATKQKWPLINLVRQLFKICGYNLKPVRMANGYSKDGKKLFKRYFKVEKDPNYNFEPSTTENDILLEQSIKKLEDIMDKSIEDNKTEEVQTINEI